MEADDLRQQNEILQKIFDHVPVAISLIDRDGRVRLVNPAWEQTFGWTQEEVLDPDFDIFSAAYPDPEEMEKVLEFRRSADPGWRDFKTTVKDGRVIDTTWSIAHLSDGTHVGIGQDITERKRAQEALEEFSRLLIEAQEMERERIARELHDEIGQALTAVQLNLQSVQTQCEKTACLRYIQDNVAIIHEALDMVRDLSFELRPSLLDDLGLFAALQWYVGRYAERSGLNAEVLVVPPGESRRLSREIETVAFRIAQEALTNVVRHAQATHVKVILQLCTNELVVTITDNGKGFDCSKESESTPAGTLGLRGMEERAFVVGGKFIIKSNEKTGTEVCARLPVKSKKRSKTSGKLYGRLY